MLKVLIKSRLQALFASLPLGNRNKKQKASTMSVALCIAVLISIIVGGVGFMFWGFCKTFVAVGTPGAFWALAMVYASMLCIVGCVFTAKTQIFESRDNELLLSMPIPVRYIFLSRMIILYLVNFALQSAILIPSVVVYSIQVGLDFSSVACFIGVLFLLPFLMLSISTLVGWIVSEISARVKHKTVITVVLLMAALGAYIYFTMSMSSFVGSDGTSFDPSNFENTLVFWWSAEAITYGSGLSFLWVSLSCIVPAIIVIAILNKTFVRLITTKRAVARVEYKGNKAKSAKISVALLKKEFLHVITSPNYLLNSSIGYVMSVVLAIIFAVNEPDISAVFQVDGLEWLASFLPALIVVVCLFSCSMSTSSAPSISLEDRQLWILRSCPIDTRTILKMKLCAFLIMSTPFAIISATILCVAYGVGVWMSLLIIATTFVSAALASYVGLFAGIKMPKLNWQNENEVIKHSGAVNFTLLGMMALSIVYGVIGYFTTEISPWFAVSCLLALSLILCALIHIYLMSKGVKEYENLKK